MAPSFCPVVGQPELPCAIAGVVFGTVPLLSAVIVEIVVGVVRLTVCADMPCAPAPV